MINLKWKGFVFISDNIICLHMTSYRLRSDELSPLVSPCVCVYGLQSNILYQHGLECTFTFTFDYPSNFTFLGTCETESGYNVWCLQTVWNLAIWLPITLLSSVPLDVVPLWGSTVSNFSNTSLNSTRRSLTSCPEIVVFFHQISHF